MANVMRTQDTISAREAEMFWTIDGRRYLIAQAKNFEGRIDKDKVEVPILGRRMKGHKSVGMSGTWSATIYYNQPLIREALQRFKNTGVDEYFEIQATNKDLESSAGRQTVIFYGCNTDGGILAKFDTEGDILDEEVSGTFEDFKIPENFKIIKEMQ